MLQIADFGDKEDLEDDMPPPLMIRPQMAPPPKTGIMKEGFEAEVPKLAPTNTRETVQMKDDYEAEPEVQPDLGEISAQEQPINVANNGFQQKNYTVLPNSGNHSNVVENGQIVQLRPEQQHLNKQQVEQQQFEQQQFVPQQIEQFNPSLERGLKFEAYSPSNSWRLSTCKISVRIQKRK